LQILTPPLRPLLKVPNIIDSGRDLAKIITLASTTSVDLSLQDETTSGVQLVGDLFGFFDSLGEETLLDTDIVLFHYIFGLIFVEIKESLGDIAKVLGVFETRNEATKHFLRFALVI